MSDLLMCRTCASTVPKHNLLPLFDRPQLREAYSLSLLSATGLQIKMNDGLPQHICNTCSDTIKIVLRFRKSCEMAHKVLVEATSKRKMLQNTVKMEKSADKFEKKHSKVKWSKTQITIKVENNELVIQTNDSEDFKCNAGTSLMKYYSKNDVSSKIKNDPESLTDYVDVELTPMFDDLESFANEEVVQTSLESNELSGNIKMLAGVKARTDASGNRRRNRGNPNSNSKVLLAQYLDESAALYTCKGCKRCYANKGSFLNHTQVHTGFKVMCEDCSKVFRNNSSLAIHQRGFHGKTDSKLKCPHCDYYGVSKGYLQVHVRKHTGERPYVCDTCGASFAGRPSLIQHISFHSTEKTIQCDQCPSMFASRYHLKVHRNKVHRPRRWSYQCPRCPKTYNAIKSCYKHMRNNHSVPRKEHEKAIRVPSGLC